MQRYRWPGYEMHLIGELQRQQNNDQFCDTLLQTDGISVPTHSCILAALSPYLSQKLSASPSPPSGQKRLLQLQPVKAQTLLKLVALLYSGEVELKGSVERNDMLAVAHLFGIRDLVEGHKNGKMEEMIQLLESSKEARGSEMKESGKTQDAQVQAEMMGRRDMDSSAKNRNCVTIGTQTGEKLVGNYITCFSRAPTPQCAPTVAQNVDFCSMLEAQNITLEEQLCYTTCPVIPNTTSGSWNYAKSTLDQSSCSVRNLKSRSVLSNNTMTFPLSHNDDTNSPISPEASISEYGIQLQALAKQSTGPKNGNTNKDIPQNRENTEGPSQASRDWLLRDENGTYTEKGHPHANIGRKNLANMKQMLETTGISVKVKLRRRAKEEVWEVVSPQDTESSESLSALTSHNLDGSNHKGLQANPPPSTVEPDILILECHPNTFYDCLNPNQGDALGTDTHLQPRGPVEESDEQIEKLLEDIMIGLNILPNLEKECKKFHYLQPSHAGVPTVGHVPVTKSNEGHSQMHAPDVPGCAFCQDLVTQSGHSASETAQNQSDSRLPAVIQQQLQGSSQYDPCVRFMGHRDGTSHLSMPLSKSQECLLPGEPTTKPMLASAASSASQNHHHPPRLEYLPTAICVETQSLHTVCMDDLRIPRCLSPLEPCHQVNLCDTIQQMSSLHGQTCLTENDRTPQFPQSAATHLTHINALLPQNTNSGLKRQQEEQQDSCPQNEGTWVESCTVKQVEDRQMISEGQQDRAAKISEPKKMKKSLKCKRDTPEAAVTPKKTKRTPTSYSKNAASLSPYKDVRLGDGTKHKVNLSSCLVSLSCNNVLLKERERATNIPSRFTGESNQRSSTTGSRRENTKETIVKTYQSRIRTRGFMKKSQESESDKNPPRSSVPVSVMSRADVVDNKLKIPKPKRGRPRKVMATEPPNISDPSVAEKSCSSESRAQTDKSLSREDMEEMNKAKKCQKKKMGGYAQVELNAMNTESNAKPDVNNKNIMPAVKEPKRPRTVTLNEFQRLVNLQRVKKRKSKISQETNGSDVECEGTARRDKTLNELCPESQRDFFNQCSVKISRQNDTHGSHNFCVVLQEEAPQMADEREQALKNPDEGKLCNAAASNTTQETDIKNQGPFETDSEVPQESRLMSDHNVYSKTADSTAPHFSDVGGMSNTSGCNQEDEEEEEEVEVDVLLYSPDSVLQPEECETGSKHVEINTDEEDDVIDVLEIDVTGDEAE